MPNPDLTSNNTSPSSQDAAESAFVLVPDSQVPSGSLDGAPAPLPLALATDGVVSQGSPPHTQSPPVIMSPDVRFVTADVHANESISVPANESQSPGDSYDGLLVMDQSAISMESLQINESNMSVESCGSSESPTRDRFIRTASLRKSSNDDLPNTVLNDSTLIEVPADGVNRTAVIPTVPFLVSPLNVHTDAVSEVSSGENSAGSYVSPSLIQQQHSAWSYF